MAARKANKKTTKVNQNQRQLKGALNPSHDPRVKLTRITPEIAASLIEKSEAENLRKDRKNRHIRDYKVNQYVQAYQDESWDAYVSVIHVDDDGFLVNGWHRCYASVMSGMAFNTIFVVTPDRELTDNTVDTGTNRTSADILFRKNFRHSNKLSTAIRMCIRHQNRGFPYDNTVIVSNSQVAKFADENRDKLERIVESIPPGCGKITSPSKLMFMQLVAKSTRQAQEFTYELINGYKLDGSGLPKGSATFQLRERLNAARMSKRFNRTSDSLTGAQETYIICNTYTKWSKGERISRIQLPRIRVGDEARDIVVAYSFRKNL